MGKKPNKTITSEPKRLRISLEQAFRGRDIERHRSQATNAHLSLANDIKTLRDTGRSPHELSFILERNGTAKDSAARLVGFSEKLSSSAKDILRRTSASQATIEALIEVDPESRSVALARMAAGAPLGGSEVFQVVDELHRSALSHDEQRILDLYVQVSQQTSRLTGAGRHPFQTELNGLLELCDEYFNLLYLREIEFEDLNAGNVAPGRQPLSSGRELGAVKRRAKKVLDSFDDLFEWAEAPRSTWAHLDLVSPNASLLAQARYALDQIAAGNLAVLDHIWSKHFPRTGGAALRYLLELPPAKAIKKASSSKPTRTLNAAVVGRGTFGVALGLEAAGFKIRTIFEEDDEARKNIRTRRSDWKVRKVGINGDDVLYKQLRRARIAEDLHLLAGAFDKNAWELRSESYDRYPAHVRVNELLAELYPDTFFFELPPQLDPSRPVVGDMMAFKIDQLGYDTVEFALSLTNFHIPQARTRRVFCGIKKSFEKRIHPPVVKSKKLNFVSYLGEAIRVRGMPKVVAKWQDTYLEKKIIDGKINNPRHRPVPDLDTLREERRDKSRSSWNSLGLSNRHFSAIVVPPQGTENLLPLSIPLLKRLQGIPGKWMLSGPFDDQLKQIIDAVPPIIARMVGHQIHAALTGEYVDLESAVREKIILRNNGTDAARPSQTAYDLKKIEADLYEKEVLAQERETEMQRLTAETARKHTHFQPRNTLRPPPPSKPPKL